jgi:carboxymethylenebutenolidase
MRIELPSGTPAELARPAGEPAMGLVVVPDVMGLRPLFDDLVARLADEQGGAVCAPELYPGREHLAVADRLAAAASLEDARVLADIVAAADATGCDRVGVLGFCMGGMYTLKAVSTHRFHRACPFYGMIRVPEAWRGPGQGEPLALLEQGDPGSVLAIIGTADHWTPPADVDALAATGATVVRYEGADHGFVHDPSRPAHRPDDAADAWSRVLDWLQA